ncbi:MAG: FAD-dependent oxidoreductase, partial [Dehalococcoidia bacterium]|nr:FAD-dependent oxidoreductase [Dehalococcoidia bacterium]
MADRFNKLFSPIKVGRMQLRNRICSLPHGGNFPEGSIKGLPVAMPGPKHAAYWEERARGGAAWIGTQATAVSLIPGQNQFKYKELLGYYKNVTESIHRHGACCTTEIMNMGSEVAGASNDVIDFPTPYAPSAFPSHHCWRIPHELTADEIHEFVGLYAEAAKVIREGGFDGVEVHVANGYLLNEFLSPLTNQRTDEYGGSLENRLRFPVEVIRAVRQAVGDDYSVGIRVSGDEFCEGGYTLEDMVEMAPLLVKAGNLDWVDVTVGVFRSAATLCTSMYFPVGNFVYCAAAIKQAVDIPVMCVGRINDPEQAEQILENNQADLIGTNRALICDSQWPNKAREGRLEEIRKCLGCNEGCWGRRRLATGMTCAINPVVGRETEPGWLDLEPAKVKKRVMVIGGGPAGLEAARVAKLRGHEVSLYEKGSELGGMTNVAAKAPGRLDFAEVGRYYTYQMKQAGVDVHLNTEVTADDVRRLKPEAVVVATGSIPLPLTIYKISGADQSNVVQVKDVLTGKVQVGKKVLVVDEDQTIQAASTADFLAS